MTTIDIDLNKVNNVKLRGMLTDPLFCNLLRARDFEILYNFQEYTHNNPAPDSFDVEEFQATLFAAIVLVLSPGNEDYEKLQRNLMADIMNR